MLKILSLTVIFIFSLASCNNDKKPASATDSVQETALKVVAGEVQTHTCTAMCKDGNHIYAHNEIGHTCSTDCGKPHVCAAQCENGSHVYVHGEAGHYCLCPIK